MISIIVCSANEDRLQQLKTNVAATVGLPYEFIGIDNSQAQQSLAAVYNYAGLKAKFDTLCFIHEDVILHTINWGRGLVQLFNDGITGLVGISGAIYKSAFPGTWSTCDPSLYRTNSIQHFAGKSKPIATNTNNRKLYAAQVAVIDGVFMATTKKIFEQYRFDEQLLKGFHGYDIDYALQVSRQYKVKVTYGLLLEHLSEGKLSQAWLSDSIAIHKKWKAHLPVDVAFVSPALKRKSDYQACASALQVALKYVGNKVMVMRHYAYLVFYFFDLNKMKYTHSVWRYVFSK